MTDISPIHELVLVASGVLREDVATDILDVQDGVDALAQIAAIRERCNLFDALIKADIIAKTDADADDNDHRSVTLDDGTVVSIKRRPSKVTTDWGRLLPAAVYRIVDEQVVDAETGEVMSPAEKIIRALPKIVPMTGSVKAKKTGLDAVGVDGDKYTEKEWGALSVRVIPPAPETSTEESK